MVISLWGMDIMLLRRRFYFFRMNQSISFQMIPATNMMMAMALIVCITFRLKLVGLFGSFFRKKYISKFNKKRRLPGMGSLLNILIYKLITVF